MLLADLSTRLILRVCCEHGYRSAVLAESVFDGVKAKMGRLKVQLVEKETALQTLQQASNCCVLLAQGFG